MTTLMAFHDVDDVDHWLSSPKREALFGPIGVTARTFVDADKSKRTGVILEVPDMAKFEEAMASEAVLEAMKSDGVRPETLVILSEA